MRDDAGNVTGQVLHADIEREEGNVTQVGTPINAASMNAFLAQTNIYAYRNIGGAL
jgi:hypothetical protein